jgi:hypothetical protein
MNRLSNPLFIANPILLYVVARPMGCVAETIAGMLV